MIYPFYCNDCKIIFTKTMSVTQYTASSLNMCPKCKGYNTRRTFVTSDISAIFKGDGFTKTTKEEVKSEE